MVWAGKLPMARFANISGKRNTAESCTRAPCNAHYVRALADRVISYYGLYALRDRNACHHVPAAHVRALRIWSSLRLYKCRSAPEGT